MPVDQPFNVYREQLTSLSLGHALWEPSPLKNLYEQVSIGDVGYVSEGFFHRILNVTLPRDHASNRVFELDPYEPLKSDPFTNIREARLAQGDFPSRHVSTRENADNLNAGNPSDTEGVTYECRGLGALLCLPRGAKRQDVIRTKVFEDYIRDNVASWFLWSQRNGLGVERMEDLILVTGCTMVDSWAAAAFFDQTMESKSSLAVRNYENGGISFHWSNVHGPVRHHNSSSDPRNPQSTWDQCVFIRGFRAKRVFFRTRLIRAEAEPLPDDPDNHREDGIQVTRVPDSSKYCDPLFGVLDYIAEKCPEGCSEDTIAIAHDDDLDLIENVEILTADAVETFLRQNEAPVLIENGAAILREDETPVLEETKVTFYAAAELGGEPVPLVIHPVLTKYLLKLDMGEAVEHDYDLPTEETTSPAVHPPMQSIKLENHQGYPQLLTVQASSDSQGVTVQDVLRTIHEDMKKPSPRRGWSKLTAEERAVINSSFKVRCRTEEDLSKGPCRFDHCHGRDRLQILAKHSPDGEIFPPQIVFSPEIPDESRIAGPSRIPLS